MRYFCGMNPDTSQHRDYDRIASAIGYLKANFRDQPSLEEVAAEAGLSPFHFQRLFKEWAGVSPKQFIHYLSLNYAKQLLAGGQSTLFDAAMQVGLSGTGRLHDLFVKIEAMTPGEFRQGGRGLVISWDLTNTIFGRALVASTSRGVCYLAFTDDPDQALTELRHMFSAATLVQQTDHFQQSALALLSRSSHPAEVRLHLKATDFQIRVWQALLSIPTGHLTTYGRIASSIGNSKASRAVGGAVGDNPVAFIIPCHRVIQGDGVYGNYRWGSVRKSAMIGWEAAGTEFSNSME